MRFPLVCLILGLTVAGPAAPLSSAADDVYREEYPAPRWRIFGGPKQGSPSEQWDYASRLRRKGKLRRAVRAYRSLVRAWPEGEDAARAQVAMAECLLARGKLQASFNAYQQAIEEYAGLIPYRTVLDRQFEIATELMYRKKGRFLFLPGFTSPEQAIPMLQKVVKNGPQGRHAAEAQYLVGYAHELSLDYEDAVLDYLSTQHRYPDSPFAEKAAFGRCHCLYLLALESPNSSEALEEAWTAVVLFLNAFPTSGHAKMAEEYRRNLHRRRAKAAYDRASFYERVARKPEAALAAYRHFVRQFPSSGWTSLAEIRIQALSKALEEKREE